MEEKRNVPKLRFPGFDGEWEQRKLGDLVRIGDIDHRMPPSVEDGIPYLMTGDFLGINGLNFDGVKHISKIDYEKLSRKIKPERGDIIFARYASVGAVRYIDFTKDFLVSYSCAIIKNGNRIDSEYLYHFLTGDNAQKQIRLEINSSSQANIGIDSMKNSIVISMPSKDEQRRIATFMSNLNNLITLHQQKLEGIKEYKKGMLQKMFPKEGEKVPEIRFLGFSGDWEQCKWNDTVDISTEMVDPTTGEYDDMPHIAPGNIESFTGRILDNVKSVKEEKLISGKFRFRPGDVVYGKINPQLGKYFYANSDGLTSADAYVFNAKNGITQKFLFSLLQTEEFFKYSVSVSKRSGMPKINRDELNAYNFLAPGEQEQERIGSFLLNIDNLITLHQRKIDELKELKKGLLQQMFV